MLAFSAPWAVDICSEHPIQTASKEIIRNPHCHPHCYVPHGKVRRLFKELGCPGMTCREVDPDVYSRQMHAFLCKYLGADKATFEACFDLPFLILAYSRRRKELHMRLFGRELDLEQKAADDGDFVTLADGHIIPRSYMS